MSLLGVSYILEKMPAGYALFDRPRHSAPEFVSFFDSYSRFAVFLTI